VPADEGALLLFASHAAYSRKGVTRASPAVVGDPGPAL
jgi:hypothetical protein